MDLSKEDLAALSPEERAALTGVDAAQALATIGDTKLELPAAAPVVAAAEQVIVEGDPGENSPADGDDGADDEEGEGDTPETAPVTAEQAAAALEELAPQPTPAPPVQPYKVEATDFKAARATLATEKGEAFKKWSDGQLSDDEYAAAQAQFDDRLADIVAAQTRAATLQEANAQHAAQERARAEAIENAAMGALAAKSKAAGQIDYAADTVAAGQFDAMFTAVKLDPKNASLTVAEQVEKAHAAVLAVRGIKAKVETVSTPTAPAAPAKPRDVPTTLSGLPNAAPNTTQDELLEQAGRLSGVDLEEFMARLPANQVQRLLRTADNSGIVY